MKRVLVAAVVAAALLGCSENKLTIQNMSDYNILVSFRAKQYPVVAGTGSTEVDDVPNGTFAYGTVYSATAAVSGIPVEEGDGLSGTMTFERSETEILLIYGSAATGDSAGASIKLWGAVSSTQQSGAVTAP